MPVGFFDDDGLVSAALSCGVTTRCPTAKRFCERGDGGDVGARVREGNGDSHVVVGRYGLGATA